MYGTYQRLNVHVNDSAMSVIRKARQVIHAKHRNNPAMRNERKKFYVAILREHQEERQLFRSVYA